jgi:hypothetical protein
VVQHVLQDGRVEVDPTQVLDAVGIPDQAEPDPVADQYGRVERATAQVVHGELGALGHPVPGGVGDRRRLGFGAGAGSAQPGQLEHLLQDLVLERAPVGRVGDADVFGRLALLLRRDLDHPAQHLGQQRLRGVRGAADDDRHDAADPALELPRQPGRVGRAAVLGGLADQRRAVHLDVEHGRDLGGPVAEAEHLDPTVEVQGGSRVGGPEIDPQPVRHPRILAGPTAPPRQAR